MDRRVRVRYDIAVGARTEKKSKLSNTRRDDWREREGEDGRKRLGGAGWCWRWLLVVVAVVRKEEVSLNSGDVCFGPGVAASSFRSQQKR